MKMPLDRSTAVGVLPVTSRCEEEQSAAGCLGADVVVYKEGEGEDEEGATEERLQRSCCVEMGSSS